MLRHEVIVLRRQVSTPDFGTPGSGAALGLLAIPCSPKSALLRPTSPFLRWHRDLVARRWTNPHRRPGRQSVPHSTAVLFGSPKRGGPKTAAGKRAVSQCADGQSGSVRLPHTHLSRSLRAWAISY